jgi:hypothetical protein
MTKIIGKTIALRIMKDKSPNGAEIVVCRQKTRKTPIDIRIELANGMSICINTHNDDPARFNYLIVDSCNEKCWDGSTDVEEFIWFNDYDIEDLKEED